MTEGLQYMVEEGKPNLKSEFEIMRERITHLISELLNPELWPLKTGHPLISSVFKGIKTFSL